MEDELLDHVQVEVDANGEYVVKRNADAEYYLTDETIVDDDDDDSDE